MFERWKQRHVAGGASSLGYSRRRVDTFLAQIGADHAHGIDGDVLAAAIREARFPLSPRGYDPATIDDHLAKLHDQLATTAGTHLAVAA